MTYRQIEASTAAQGKGQPHQRCPRARLTLGQNGHAARLRGAKGGAKTIEAGAIHDDLRRQRQRGDLGRGG